MAQSTRQRLTQHSLPAMSTRADKTMKSAQGGSHRPMQLVGLPPASGIGMDVRVRVKMRVILVVDEMIEGVEEHHNWLQQRNHWQLPPDHAANNLSELFDEQRPASTASCSVSCHDDGSRSAARFRSGFIVIIAHEVNAFVHSAPYLSVASFTSALVEGLCWREVVVVPVASAFIAFWNCGVVSLISGESRDLIEVAKVKTQHLQQV